MVSGRFGDQGDLAVSTENNRRSVTKPHAIPVRFLYASRMHVRGSAYFLSRFDALSDRRRFALFFTAVRLVARGGTRIRPRDLCRRRSRRRLVRGLPRPDRGGEKYLSLLSGVTRVVLCSGNHDLDERSPEGEKISRWIGEVREIGIACDGDSFALGDTFFTVCPW